MCCAALGLPSDVSQGPRFRATASPSCILKSEGLNGSPPDTGRCGIFGLFLHLLVHSHPPTPLPADVRTVLSNDHLPLCPHKAQPCHPPIAKGAGHRSSAAAWGHAARADRGRFGRTRPRRPGERLRNVGVYSARGASISLARTNLPEQGLDVLSHGGVDVLTVRPGWLSH